MGRILLGLVIYPPLTVTARKMGFTQITSFQEAGITWAYNSIDVTSDFAQKNHLAKKFKPEDFFALRYLKELDQSGFLDRVFK